MVAHRLVAVASEPALERHPWATDPAAVIRIARTPVAIIGSSTTACLLAPALAAMGFRDVVAAARAELPAPFERLLAVLPAGREEPASLGALTAALSSRRTVPRRLPPVLDRRSLSIVPTRDVVLEASGEPATRLAVLRRAAQTGENVVLACGAAGRARVAVLRSGSPGATIARLAHEVASWPAGPDEAIAALAAAGLALEALRQIVLPNDGDEPIDVINAAFAAPAPFGARVLLVGAGALGTWFALCAALLERPTFRSLRVLDSDHVERSNFNRQLLYVGAEGRSKAVVMVERLGVMMPGLHCEALPVRLDSTNTTLLGDADLAVGMPDNAETRILLGEIAGMRGAPLLTAASSHDAADAQLYLRGVSQCEGCRKGLRLALPAEAPSRSPENQSCAARPEPSVIATNMIGAAMAWDLLARFVARENSRWPIPRAYSRGRLGSLPAAEPCQCHVLARWDRSVGEAASQRQGGPSSPFTPQRSEGHQP